MIDRLPESSQIQNEQMGLQLLDSHTYWAPKRTLFNVIVCAAGLVSILAFDIKITLPDLLAIAMYGCIANALYSAGYVLESLLITQSKGRLSFQRFRVLLFWGGSLLYAFVTILFGFVTSGILGLK